MSIKIEIEGASIEEVADKLLALGSKLSGAAVAYQAFGANEAAPVGEPAKAPRTRKAKPADPVADGAPVAAETATGTGSTTETEAVAPVSGPEPTEATTASSPVVPEEHRPPALDFDKDVTPAVLNAVEKIGRDKVAAILDEFGVARASQLDEAQWPELLAKLADAA